MVLGVLAIVWIVVLGSYARERLGSRHRDSVSAFRVQLTTLERTQPGSRPIQTPQGTGPQTRSAAHWRSEAARIRRRNILLGLATAVVVSLLLVVSAPSAMTALLTVLCTVALAGYIGLLVNQQRIIAEQQAKVHRIHPTRRRPLRVQPPQPPMVVGGSRRS